MDTGGVFPGGGHDKLAYIAQPIDSTNGLEAVAAARPENFPVASVLLAAPVRRQVLAFYRYARAADDIADAPLLDPAAKLATLDAFATGLGGSAGASLARDLARQLEHDPALLAHAAALLPAFRRDVAATPCRDWADLMEYCAGSAAPVGRFLLDLHHQDPALYPAADALCAALQVLNHLQDCADDLARLGRVYLPADWLAAAGATTADLTAPRTSPALRRVLDRCLDGVADLLDRAAPLVPALTDRRLRLETAVIVALARRLAATLRRSDPLAGRVALPATAKAAAVLAGLVQGWRGQNG